MDERGHGIILRTRPLTETSLIIHWLTQDHGRIHTVAKGARRAKSSFRGKLDLLFEADFSFQKSRRSDLHTLKEVHLTQNHPQIRQDIARLQLLAYTTRLLERATEPEHPVPGIHAIVSTLLNHLDNHPPRPALAYAVEIKTLNELGLGPPLDHDRLDDGTRRLLEQLAILDWESITQLKPTHSQATAAGLYLGNFIQQHLDSIPKGRNQVVSN